MNLLTGRGWQMWKILPGGVHRLGGACAAQPQVQTALVRLIAPVRRVAKTPVEAQVVSILTNEGAISYERLVQRVADELYQKELRHGAGALDIGLFGSRLFDRDVFCALEAADGVLWKISWVAPQQGVSGEKA